MGELQRGWERFWKLPWWWKGPILGFIALVLVGAAGSIVGGGGDSGDAGRTPAVGMRVETSGVTVTPSPLPTPAPTPHSTPSPAPVSPSPTASQPPLPSYQVVEKDDVSFGSTVRIRVKATTDFPLAKDQARAVMDAIIKEVTDGSRVNAALVFLYDGLLPVSGTFSAYSLAKATFAPDGDWGSANQVKAGDYSRHRTVYEFAPKLDDPQAAMPYRPGQREAEMCRAWDEAAQEYDPEGELSDEAIAEIAAVSIGASPQDILDALLKCVVWVFK